MSLKVWLPLNKDTRNVGLAENIEITSTNTEFKEDIVSPLGNGARLFKSNNSNLQLPSNNTLIKNKPEISLAFWCYQTIATGQTLFTFMKSYFDFSFYNNILYVRTNGNGGDKSGNALQLTLPQQDINTWHHYAFTFNRGLVKCYIDGDFSKSGTTAQNDTMFSGITTYYIGGYSSTYKFSGYTCDFRIYDNALRPDDVSRLYQNRNIFEIPYSQEAEKPEYPLWLKLLHHNAPANNLFTAANCKKNSDNDLYSRCGWLFGNTIFKLDNGKYEMLAKEKTESGSTENIFRWTQTSSPTASTITGFSAITNVSGSHLLGLKHNGSYAALHNGSTYWCACGSYTKYNGGNPGFKDVIKSGYLDLFVRAEIKHLPSKYEELEYIQSTGTQYIDTGINPKIKPRAVVKMAIINATDCDYWGNSAVNGSCYYADFKSYNLQYYRYGATTSQNVNFTVGQNEIHTWDVSDKVYVDGSLKFTSTNTYTYNSSQKTIQIFKAARASYYSSYKLYNFKLYDGDELCRNFVPAKRKSDNVIGLYDLVSHKFFTNSGTGSFTGA